MANEKTEQGNPATDSEEVSIESLLDGSLESKFTEMGLLEEGATEEPVSEEVADEGVTEPEPTADDDGNEDDLDIEAAVKAIEAESDNEDGEAGDSAEEGGENFYTDSELEKLSLNQIDLSRVRKELRGTIELLKQKDKASDEKFRKGAEQRKEAEAIQKLLEQQNAHFQQQKEWREQEIQQKREADERREAEQRYARLVETHGVEFADEVRRLDLQQRAQLAKQKPAEATQEITTLREKTLELERRLSMMQIEKDISSAMSGAGLGRDHEEAVYKEAFSQWEADRHANRPLAPAAEIVRRVKEATESASSPDTILERINKDPALKKKLSKELLRQLIKESKAKKPKTANLKPSSGEKAPEKEIDFKDMTKEQLRQHIAESPLDDMAAELGIT